MDGLIMDVLAMIAVYYGVGVDKIRILKWEIDEDSVMFDAEVDGELMHGSMPDSYGSGHAMVLEGDSYEVRQLDTH
jgi:hypothetical protein